LRQQLALANALAIQPEFRNLINSLEFKNDSFSAQLFPPEYFEIQAQTAKEMIERDRNNPSVILWGLSGEVDDPEKSVDAPVGMCHRSSFGRRQRGKPVRTRACSPVGSHLDGKDSKIINLFETVANA
jgi:hypothetical protein